MAEPMVLYHANCMDGFASACVVAQHLEGKGEYIACQYGDPVPAVDGRDVYIVDFSWKEPEMLDIVSRCKSLVWLDHHKTSADYFDRVRRAAGAKASADSMIHDQNYSGATITWASLFGSGCPEVLRYVQDRDLWTWKLPNSKAVSAALADTFDVYNDRPEGCYAQFLGLDTHQLVQQGEHLLRKQAFRVAANVKRAVARAQALSGAWRGLNVSLVNCDGDISETGHALCELGADVAVMFFMTETGEWVHSLRARHTGVDVSEIAEHYGGGGHAAAAGFKHQLPIALWASL